MDNDKVGRFLFETQCTSKYEKNWYAILGQIKRSELRNYVISQFKLLRVK